MKPINYKGKKFYRLPKNTTKAEIERLIKNGAEFYIEEEKES